MIKEILLVFLAGCVIYTAYLFLFIRLSKHIYILSADEFEKQLTKTKRIQLIDLRIPRGYRKSRIANAQNIDFMRLDFHRKIKTMDNTQPVMVYCLSGFRSKMVLPTLCKAGFTNIYELNAGFSGWLRAGKPTVQEKSTCDAMK